MKITRWLVVPVLLVLFTKTGISQQLRLGNNPYTVEKSAVLELQSTNQGLLFSRIADTAVINVLNPPDGMVIYFTPMQRLLLRANGYWQSLTPTSSLSSYWAIDGNSNGAEKMLGTVDNYALPFITNNTERMRISNTGNIGIGTSTFDATNPEKLLVDAGATSSFNVISGKGSINNYLQLNIQNRSNGNTASSDIVATADNGSESVNYVDLGINSSGFSNTSYPILNGANNAYLYSTGNDFVIGNATSGKPLRFFTGGYATANERMRIDGNGRVGIGTTAPTAILHLKAGTTSANTAPVKFTSGSLMTTAEAGAVEFLTDKFYGTITTGAARKEFTLNDAALTAGRVPVVTTNGRLTSNANLVWDNTNSRLGIGSATPSEVLDITGNFRLSGAFMPNNSAGTEGQVLTSNGAGAAPSWTSLGLSNLADATITSPANGQLLQYNGSAWVNSTPAYLTAVDTSNISNFYQKVRGLFSAAAPVTLTNGQVGITQASASSNGYLSSTDWSTFNNKLSSVDTTNISNFSVKVRGLFSAGSGITYNAATGAISSSVSTANLWAYNGNTVAAEKTMGTIDNYALPFITNNTERMRISNSGNVGIGTTSPSQKLDVNGTIVSSATTYPNYAYNASNRMAFGESNVPANETGSVVQFGSGSNTRNMLFAFTKTNVNTSFFGNDGTQMMLGSEAAAPITFRTGLSYTAANIMASGTERMRITASGVGIGTTSPSQALDITGNLKFSGALMPGNSAGTAGQLLASNGAGAAPSWTSLGLSNLADVTLTSPANGQLLQYNGSAWVNSTPAYLTAVDTTNISNFSVKVRGLFSAGSGITYNAATGAISSSVSTDNLWAYNGNTVTAEKTMGTIDNYALPFITNNTERMRINANGKVGIGVTNPGNQLVVKDTLEIRRTGTLSTLLFSNTAGAGDFRIAGDGGDLFWQGGGGRALQMGSYHTTILGGDRQVGTLPSFTGAVANTGVLVQGQRDASVPLAIQANSATQTANLTEWRNSSGTALSIVDGAGSMAIGTSTFDATNPEKLLVDAGNTSSFNVISGKGTINNYLQLNIQNKSNGTTASSDLVATANNGTESINFVDLGINSSGYSATGILAGANNGYLYSTGNDFVIGNATASKSLSFFTGGTNTSNERMRIDGTGKVGIGNTSPTEVLDVTGNLKFSGAIMPGGSAGTSGYILTSNGAGATPTWTNPTSIASGTYWTLNGNNVSSEKTLGTTSNYDLPFITNNTEKMRLSSDGGLAIGTNTFDATAPEMLLVDAGNTSSYNLINAKGSVNNYLQFNIQNEHSGSAASTDIVATNNTGTETSRFIDMGINSSNYSNSGILGGANNAYLYSTGSDLIIGNSTSGASLRFFTGGTLTTNERVRIDPSGKLGVGTTSPTATMDVAGTFKLGSSGTVLNNMIKGSVSVTDNNLFNYTSTLTVTTTVTGATVNGTVIVNPRSSLPAGVGIAWARVATANTLTIAFTNSDTALKSIGSVTFDVTIIQ